MIGSRLNTAPKPAEVRDGIVDAITSGQQAAFSPQITMSNQEIPPTILEMPQPLVHKVSGNIQPAQPPRPFVVIPPDDPRQAEPGRAYAYSRSVRS
jgi:hypothetical protein